MDATFTRRYSNGVPRWKSGGFPDTPMVRAPLPAGLLIPLAYSLLVLWNGAGIRPTWNHHR